MSEPQTITERLAACYETWKGFAQGEVYKDALDEITRLQSQWTHMQEVAKAAGFDGCTHAIVVAQQLQADADRLDWLARMSWFDWDQVRGLMNNKPIREAIDSMREKT